MNETTIDEKIETIIEGANWMEVGTRLCKDAYTQDPDNLERWQEAYKTFPSCKPITKGYENQMIEKYIKTYKKVMCN